MLRNPRHILLSMLFGDKIHGIENPDWGMADAGIEERDDIAYGKFFFKSALLPRRYPYFLCCAAREEALPMSITTEYKL